MHFSFLRSTLIMLAASQRKMHGKYHTLRIHTVTACCVTNHKVTFSIPAGVSGFFVDIKSCRSHYDPGVDSASNRNEYQEPFLRVKAAGA